MYPSIHTLLTTAGNSTYTTIYLNGTATPGATPTSPLMITRLDVFVDKGRSGGMTSPCVQGGPVDLPHNGIKASELGLHVFVDRSMLEVYALGGHGRVTSRVYPLVAGAAWGVRAFGAVGAGMASPPWVMTRVDIFSLDSCWRSA